MAATAIQIRRVGPSTRAPAPPLARRSGSSRLASLKRELADKAASASRRAAAVAREEKHTITAVGAGVALGLLERFQPGMIDTLSVAGLKPAATLGLAAWALNRFGIMRNKVMEHAATGLLTIAAYDLAKTAGADSVSGVVGNDPNVLDFDR